MPNRADILARYKLADRDAFEITEGLYDNDGSRRVFFRHTGDPVTIMFLETAETLAAEIRPHDPAMSAYINRLATDGV